MPSKMLKFSLILIIFTFLSHCSIFSQTDDPLNQDLQLDQKYGEGIMRDSYENSMKNKSTFMDLIRGGGSKFEENIIWNVALEKISFMPLQSSDQMSGVITTEWYQIGDDLNNRIKLVVYVKSTEIDESSLDVKVFKEVFDGSKWNASNQSSELALKIKKSILDTARELYIANEMS